MWLSLTEEEEEDEGGDSCSSLIDREEPARTLVGSPSHFCIRFSMWFRGQPAWAGIRRRSILSGLHVSVPQFFPL